MKDIIPTPAVFAGSLTLTFEYRTRGVHTSPQVRWTFSTPGTISCPVLVDQGVVYVGDNRGVLSAIDAQSGTLLWSFHVPSAF
jgi:outer membrane protein assembly factor BamB